MTDDSTPEGTVEQEASAPDADALLDRFLGVSDEEDSGKEQAEPENDDPEAVEAAAEGEDTDPPAEDEAVEADDAAQEQGEQSQDSEAGRFVGDNGKVRLDDGTVITIADLKRGNLREADYTRKTQELSASRKELETRQAELTQHEQTIGFAIEVAQASLPAMPDQSMIHTDPIGYIQQKAEYDNRVQQLQQLMEAKQQVEATRESERARAQQQWMEGERDRLVEAMPELKDPAKLQQFNTDLVSAIGRYGFSAQDAAGIQDHRLVLLAKDLIAYHKLMAAKPKAIAKTGGKPPITPGRRSSPQGEKQRDRNNDWQRLRASHGKDTAALDRILDDIL